MLLFATVALTGCRFAEHGRRAAIDAFASFVLGSISQTPLTQPAPRITPRVRVASAPAATATIADAACPSPAPAPAVIALPAPRLRIASIDLAPAAAAVARLDRIVVCADVARARVEARMTLAEIRGARPDRLRRIVVVLPEVAPEVPSAPATL